MLGQPLVDERVVRCQQVEHVPVAAHDAVEEELGLGLEGITQRVVEVGELVVVGCNRPQVPGMQPLTAEVADKGIGLRVGNHPAHFTLEHRRIAKLTLRRQIHQRIVRDAAPEEKRQSRRQLDIGHVLKRARLRGRAVLFDAEHKRRAGKQPAQRHLDAAVEISLGSACAIEGEQATRVALRHRPPIRLARQRRENLRGTRVFVGCGLSAGTRRCAAGSACLPVPLD